MEPLLESRARHSLAPGSTFRGLKIHGVLGAGAMGAAYLASHQVLRRPAVVKVFAVAPDDPFEEAYLAARARSAQVVAVHDAGWEAGLPFVVQDYVDGMDLEELRRLHADLGRPLAPGLVCRVVVDACLGLHAVHQAGVVHRDIKPANLFLAGDGATLVGDFGVAVTRGEGAAGGALAGTPLFLAPEQWLRQPNDRRTDLYALGATAHLLLTQRPPFQARSLPEFMQQHLERAYEPPLAEEPRAAFLFALIRKMLAKSLSDRPRTAEAVARELAPLAPALPRYERADADHATVGRLRVSLGLGDLATTAADVLVNAANVGMTMEVGVARALRLAGGEALAREALGQAPVPMGAVAWTGPGALSARHVAHAVAAYDGAVCIQRCALRTLLGAEARGARSAALPALGAGVGGVPMELSAKLTLEAARTFAAMEPRTLEDLRVVLWDAPALHVWREILAAM